MPTPTNFSHLEIFSQENKIKVQPIEERRCEKKKKGKPLAQAPPLEKKCSVDGHIFLLIKREKDVDL
jgi:hypothetical protein